MLTYAFKLANAKVPCVSRWWAFWKGFEVHMLWTEIKLQSLKESLSISAPFTFPNLPSPPRWDSCHFRLSIASLHAPTPWDSTLHTASQFWNLLHLNCSIHTTLPSNLDFTPIVKRSSLSPYYIPAAAYHPDGSKPWFITVILSLLYIKKDMWFYPKS